MRAARYHGKKDVRIEEVPEPNCGPREVKIANAYAGICGSDLHIYYNPESLGLDYSRPHPITGAKAPQILGHEFSGTVAEVGSDVEGYAIGDKVAVWPIYYCGTCPACEKGSFNACRTIAFHGLSAHGGGMAEYTTVPVENLHKVPDTVDLRLAALVEPMAVAWHAVRLSGVKAGQTALIAGAGPIGVGVWFALKAHGVETILVSEPNMLRRRAIESVGADSIIDPTSGDLTAIVMAATFGRGVDVAFDAAGAGAALLSTIAHLTPGGRTVVVGAHEREVSLNPTQLVMSETTITGSLAYLPEDFDAVISAMSDGLYEPAGWVSDFRLDSVVEAIESLHDGKFIKVLISARN